MVLLTLLVQSVSTELVPLPDVLVPPNTGTPQYRYTLNELREPEKADKDAYDSLLEK